MRRLIKHKQIGIIFICLAAALLFFSVAYSILKTEPNRAFDREVWRNKERIYEDDYPRLAMINDLRSKLKRGMSYDETVKLLGPPTQTPYFANHDLVYWLGAERSVFSIDNVWLVLNLSKGELQSTDVLTD